ncbi:MAG TPA: hypothetical protein VJ302_35085 [Blastocatellia bacterium]|nr:hypothetical protein [Blastocatellia bacterium]
MLEAINLSKSYNYIPALDSLNLKIESGEVFCLLGAKSQSDQLLRSFGEAQPII